MRLGNDLTMPDPSDTGLDGPQMVFRFTVGELFETASAAHLPVPLRLEDVTARALPGPACRLRQAPPCEACKDCGMALQPPSTASRSLLPCYAPALQETVTTTRHASTCGCGYDSRAHAACKLPIGCAQLDRRERLPPCPPAAPAWHAQGHAWRVQRYLPSLQPRQPKFVEHACPRASPAHCSAAHL